MNRRAVSVGVAAVLAAVLISFLIYTHQLGEALRRDAVVFSRMYANAFHATASDDPARVDEALFDILRESLRLEIPIVLTNSAGQPLSAANLPFEADLDTEAGRRRVKTYVQELDTRIRPYEAPEFDLQFHFGEPFFMRYLKWIPWLQVTVLLVTVGGGGWLIYTSFQGERDRIWSAMARESAHQMGTPLSSLVGWLEQLKEDRGPEAEGGDVDLVKEMEADVDRLLKVSRRFELIGHSPSLHPVRLDGVVRRLEEYFSARLPSLGSSVELRIEIPEDAPPVLGDERLLEWAFENLIKNSLDALAGREGTIGIEFVEAVDGDSVYRVWDTGPGVAPEVRNRLFDIGVTTKERGWGVGLSLTRRIVEEVHDGDIELEPGGEGAEFRLRLPVAEPRAEETERDDAPPSGDAGTGGGTAA